MTSSRQRSPVTGAPKGLPCIQCAATIAPARRDAEVVSVRGNSHKSHRVPRWSRGLCVLIVDDEPDNADSLSLLIEMWGHQARQAYTAAAALAMVNAYPPDVFVLDLAMPGMDGCQLARHLRRQAAFTKATLIAMTGYCDPTHRLCAAKAGFDHYFIKPIDLAMLESMLSRTRAGLCGDRPMQA